MLGAALEAHYVTLLRELDTRRGMLGQIFTKAQNKIHWIRRSFTASSTWLDRHRLGHARCRRQGRAIYEGLLENNAEDTKSGAGQYFTPRAVIRAMVECMRPEPGKRIGDPACRTGGFYLGCYDFFNDGTNFTASFREQET